jgi:hypothetical protein
MNVFFYPSTIKKIYVKTDDGLLHCAVNIFSIQHKTIMIILITKKKTFYLDFLLIIRQKVTRKNSYSQAVNRIK